jgi:hypothetical protein
MATEDLGTSATLLGRLRDPRDQEAWGTFARRYRDRIFGWCVRWGLQDEDA